MEQDQNLLESILKAVVNHPEQVKVARSVDELGVLLSVGLGEGDAGIVIGKEGRSIKAIRSVMNLLGYKNRAHINVRLDVPNMPRNAGFGESAD